MDFQFIEGSVEPVLDELRGHNTFGFDLETTGLSPIDSRVLLLQIGFPHKSYVVDASKADVKSLLPFLADPKWKKLIHNAKFEQKFMQHSYETFINNVFDSMLAEHVILSEKYSKSLANLAEKYAGVKLDKSKQTSFIGMKPMEMFSQEQLRYAAKDVDILFPIYEEQQRVLKEDHLDHIADFEFDLAGVVAGMELEGIPIDQSEWRTNLQENAKLHEQARLDILDLVYKNTSLSEQLGMFERAGIDLNSPKQVGDALLSLGVDLPKTPKGHYKTDERTLGTINHPVAKRILDYRGYEKIRSAYGESLLSHIHPFTNRLHPDFLQIGTETGRFACKDPNVQQIPEQFRQCVTLKDYKIISSDYSQMELRIIAELTDDPGLISAFEQGDDPHKATAALMFNIPLDAVTKEQRFIAKTINFGLAYGMQGKKLRDLLNHQGQKVSLSGAYELMDRHKKTYPKVSQWFYQQGEKAYVQGYCETISGRKRFFTRPTDVDEDTMRAQVAAIKRQGGNAPIQGTNADITKMAMIDLDDQIRTYGYRARVIIPVHDELVVLAHKRHATYVKEIVEDAMLTAAERVLRKVPVKVTANVDDRWNH